MTLADNNRHLSEFLLFIFYWALYLCIYYLVKKDLRPGLCEYKIVLSTALYSLILNCARVAQNLNFTSFEGLLQKEHPGIAVSVKTQQATRRILNNIRDKIVELRGEGVLDEHETCKLELVTMKPSSTTQFYIVKEENKARGKTMASTYDKMKVL